MCFIAALKVSHYPLKEFVASPGPGPRNVTAPSQKPIETSTSARASANITRVGSQGSPIPDSRAGDRNADSAVMQLCERVPACVQVCPNGNKIRNLTFREEM